MRTNIAGRAIRAEGGRCAFCASLVLAFNLSWSNNCWRNVSLGRVSNEKIYAINCTIASFFFPCRFFLLFFLKAKCEPCVELWSYWLCVFSVRRYWFWQSYALSFFSILDYITEWNFRRKAIKCFLTCWHCLKCPAVSLGPVIYSWSSFSHVTQWWILTCFSLQQIKVLRVISARFGFSMSSW